MNAKHDNLIGRSIVRWCLVGLAAGAGVAGLIGAQQSARDVKLESPKEAQSVSPQNAAAKSGSSRAPTKKSSRKQSKQSPIAKEQASSSATKEATAEAKEIKLSPQWLQALTWRSIGPANMSGRSVDLAVVESDPTTYWVATASGGLVKTTNNGITFTHQFDREATVSIGSVCVAPSNPNTVWVGTGENNPRNSVSYGDGVYKSTDGGKTWKNMGLRKSFQVGRILIHPKDPNIVYVGALGRLYGPNEERGVFKTTNGGETWEKVLYVDDKTGVIDMRMNPDDPETLLAATWERWRDGFDSHPGDPPPEGYNTYDPMKKWGPGSGLYKTTDGGQHWRRITNGLPTCNLGRIGLDWYRKDPNVVFAIVDSEKIGMGTPPKASTSGYAGFFGEDADNGARLTRIVSNAPAAKAGLLADDIVRSLGDKEIANYAQLVEELRNYKAGEKVKFKVLRQDKPREFTVTLDKRSEPQSSSGGGVFLGITGRDAEGGVRLASVGTNTAAAKAGLKANDVIQSFGGREIQSNGQLTEEIHRHKVGDKVSVTFRRGDATRTVEVTLGERPTSTPARPSTGLYGGQIENVQDEQGTNSFQYGGVYKSADGGETWQRINSVNPRPMYFSKIRVDPNNDQLLYVLGVQLFRSTNGGKTFKTDTGRGIHADQHTMWINPRDGRHILIGTDGGFYATYDRTANWDHLNTTALGQFYHVAISPKQPYYVVGGLQDNGSWMGPAIGLGGIGPINEDWLSVGSGDGFVCRVDPDDPNLVYYESQNGNIFRRNLRTGERVSIRPASREGAPPYRFNWNTPFILSQHNPSIFYCGGNYVFRSLNRGSNAHVFSPEITLTKRGSATALAESPRNPNVLYAGTDDGALWLTRDGGKTWTNLTRNVGLPKPQWVASIEPSRFVEGRAYVAFDCHRADNDDPCAYVTEDFGKTWKSLRANLPWGSSRVLREDLQNPNLLYLGTEFGAWCSLDRGKFWNRLGTNLPTVALHEFALHPGNGEIVAATHGRSLWVMDVAALRQIKPEHLVDKPALHTPGTAVRWRSEPARGRTNRRFIGQNPTAGAQLYYSLPKKTENVALKIFDISGAVVRELTPKKEPGLHRLTWDLRAAPSEQRTNVTSTARSSGAGKATAKTASRKSGTKSTASRAPSTSGSASEPGRPVAPGVYRVVLTVDGENFAQNLRVESDPIVPDTVVTQDVMGMDEEEEEEEEEREREREQESGQTGLLM